MKGLYRVQAALERGDYTAQRATRPDVPKPKADNAEHIYETFALAEEAASEGEAVKAESLFKQVIAADPEGLGMAAAERLGEIKFERDRATAYSNIVRMAANEATLKGAQAAWRAFVPKYGDYDPENLAVRLMETPPPMRVQHAAPLQENPAPIIVTPTKPRVVRVEDILPPPFAWCDISAGKVRLITEDGYMDSYVPKKMGKVFEVQPFTIAKYPITNAQFQVFVDANDGYNNRGWWEYSLDAKIWRGKNQLQATGFEGDNHPRTNVCWYEAVAFCQWLSTRTNLSISLPSEQQWQYAAQGADGRKYPWGDTFDTKRCNTKESNIGQTTPITQYEGEGDSFFGVVDMSGNVWEWCSTDYYSGSQDIARLDPFVLQRGGSWGFDHERVRVEARGGNQPNTRMKQHGFRVVLV
jgi:formylglycine-generating enzyme required for sulfatase activity